MTNQCSTACTFNPAAAGHAGMADPTERYCSFLNTSVDQPPDIISARESRLVSAAAGITAASALACSACCVLPFALPTAIVAISGGTLALFAKIHPLVTLVAFIAVVTSWLWIVSRTLQTRRKPAPATLITMSIATMMLALSMMWPLIEHALFRLLRA
jgi:hypothetical protein